MSHTPGPNGKTPRQRKRFGYWLIAGSCWLIFAVFFGLKTRGRRNVPMTGPFILASNHKSWFDPPIVGGSCPREIHFAAKRELFNIPILGRIITYANSIPVKRSGFDREAIVKLGEAIDGGGGIIIFPEGTRYTDERLHPPKGGVGMMAIHHPVPIVPVYIANSANMRRQFFRRQLTITYGEPFTVAELGELPAGRDAYQAVAEEVMRRIAKTGGVEPPIDLTSLTKPETV